MRGALLLNSERPPSLQDLKVALLTYESVTLVDPSDRDLFPPTGLPIAMGMPPIMSMPGGGPVRELGKTSDYDDEFAKLVDAARPAFAQGSVSVVRTYKPISPQVMIGMVDLGDFPLELQTLLTMFRAAAADPEFLTAAISGDRWLFENPDRVWEVTRARGGADGTINNLGPLADLAEALANDAIREPLSNIARARVGHTIKLVGYCMTQGLIPHGSSPHQDNIVRLFMRNAARLIDQVEEFDPYWNFRNRALKLVHDEYLDFDRLDQMSVADVLALRTAAWGRQAEAREGLFEAVGTLARQSVDEQDFDRAVASSVRDYRQRAAEVEDERAALNFKIVCELGKYVLGGTGATAAGALTSLGTAVGVASVVIGGAYLALQQFQDLKPISDLLKAAEAEYQTDFRFGIHNFFDRMP